MSNSSSETETLGTTMIKVDIGAEDAAAELFLLDANLRLVAKGRGRLVVLVSPGVYKINVRAGFQTDEYLEVLDPIALRSNAFTKTYPLPKFASPAPLSGTFTTDEALTRAATNLSALGNARPGNGKGSWIFVLARDWISPDSRDRESRPINVDPARGLTLWHPETGPVVDLSRDAETGPGSFPWGACHVEVEPGPYLLTLDTGSGARLRQTVMASPGWQTQIFLLQKDYQEVPGLEGRSDEPVVCADLTGASILMSRGGFAPAGRQAYLGEMARMGLIKGRQVLPDDFLDEMLREKFVNPMLGICATYLLLRRDAIPPLRSRKIESRRPIEAPEDSMRREYPEVSSLPGPREIAGQSPPRVLNPQDSDDRDLLKTVIGNLRNLLGRDHPHPDVEALALVLGPEGEARATLVPPMLRRSWSLVLDASVTRPELVPEDSLVAKAAQRIWGGEPWLLWTAPAPAVGPVSRSFAFEMAPSGLESFNVRGGADFEMASPEEEGLDSFARALLSQMKRFTKSESGLVPESDPTRGISFSLPAEGPGPLASLSVPDRMPIDPLDPGRIDDTVMAHLVRNFNLPRSVLMERIMEIDRQIANKQQWCLAWYASQPKADSNERAALLRDAKWNRGDVITVSFLDGDPAVQAKVKKVAQRWTVPGQTAGLRLAFPAGTTDTLVRISFRYSGSWSTIGTTCKQVPAGQPTMNYGWLTPHSTDEEVQRVVLHEFGHALGLIHEHQNPDGGIPWDREAVYAALSGPPNNWTKDVIDSNMFKPYDANETNFTKLDKNSIMMYPIPATWTTDGYSVGLNSDLSPTDIEFIRKQYP